MNRFFMSRQQQRLWLALLAAVLGGVCEVKGADEVEANVKKVVLEEAEEKALRGFIEKLKAAKKRLYEEDMRELVKSLEQEVGLDEPARSELAQLAVKAVEATMDGWDQKAHDWLSPYVGRAGNSIREMARWPVEQIAKSPGVEGVVPPDQQGGWNDSLRKVMTSQQWSKWEEKLKRDETEMMNRVREHVSFSADNQRPNMEGEMTLAVAAISNTLKISGDRLEALKRLADESVLATVETWKKKGMEAMMKMDRERREMVMVNGNSGWQFGEEGVLPQEQEQWKTGLRSLLSEAEAGKLEEIGKQRRERRLRAVQSAILQVMDEGIAFTTSQRREVRPLLKPVAEKLLSQMQRYFNLDSFSVSSAMRDSDLKQVSASVAAIMEPEQKAGYERFLNPERYAENEEGNPEGMEDKAPPANEEELEALLSLEMIRRYEGVRAAKMLQIQTSIEDLQRQVGLRDEQIEELSLAAAGAVQDSLREVRQQLGSWMRQSVANIPNEGVRARLAGIGSAGFGNEPEARLSVFWRVTLKRTLDEQQLRKWHDAEAAREAEMKETQLLLVLSELDQQLALTSEQAAFFEGHLGRILDQYSDDLDAYSGSRQWHLHAYSLLTPVMGVPEEEMKKQLSEGQMDLWLEKSASQVRHYWEGVKRKYDAREKAKAEAEKKSKGAKS
jgi:hypothetical protein